MKKEQIKIRKGSKAKTDKRKLCPQKRKDEKEEETHEKIKRKQQKRKKRKENGENI